MLLAVGDTAALLPRDGVIALAPQHPAAVPGFQLSVHVEDGVVVTADPRPGLMHRSAEKLFESRDIRQILALVDRHDWLSAISSEVGVALAVEEALGITPPERATWIRTLLVEANRIAAALAFLAPIAGSACSVARDLLDQQTDLLEAVTGARVHPAFVRVGGVASDLDDEHLDAYAGAMDAIDCGFDELVAGVDAYRSTVTGLAVLSRTDAREYVGGGVVARASGVDADLRRDAPGLAYPHLAGVAPVVTSPEGDAAARYAVLLHQVPGSVTLVRSCLDVLRSLGPAPVNVPLPKVVRLPEGVTYSRVEGPLGISGCLLAGAGDKHPVRL
jgi:NADH-quinone oxidoreductase subunit D